MRANDRVADALAEFAELLAISGGNGFRVRAYEKAARNVREYPVDLDDVEPGALTGIPNVGASIAAKIQQWRDSGRIAELDDLRAQVPGGVRALLGVPGLGPRRAHQVYQQLGVASVPELLDAAHRHRLRTLRGWGSKREDNLCHQVRRAGQAGGRVQLPVALSVAEEVLAMVRALPGVVRASPAGSLRRMCETVGDVDILVAADDPVPVMESVCAAPLVASVLAAGPTRCSVLTRPGLQVDLRVVGPRVWGAALQYFTGSKAHNVRLRAIAIRHGLKLSEYGLFRVGPDADGEGPPVAAATEEQVYACLGLAWIPPTLREDRGEVEAAEAGCLPRLVERADLRGDLHLHTTLTDGLADLDQMVAAAAAHGYRYCAVTDHAPLLAMQRMTADKALAQRAQIRALNARLAGITVLHGSELNIQPDGSLDWESAFLAGFDVLIASIHSQFAMSRDDMTRRLIRAIENPYVNVIGHPTARSIGHRPPIDFDADAVFAAAARHTTALEINSFPDRLDLSDQLARRAAGHGVRFAISTDAHAVRHLDNVRFGVATAQRGWIEPHLVINTWPLADLRRFLTQQRPAAERSAS